MRIYMNGNEMLLVLMALEDEYVNLSKRYKEQGALDNELAIQTLDILDKLFKKVYEKMNEGGY